MRPEKGYLPVGVSHKGYISKPPVPEDRQANRLRDEATKRKKDAAKEATARNREKREKHARACKLAQAEGAPRPATPESTEGEDSSDGELNFSESDDDEAVTGVGSLPAYLGAGGEGSTVTLGEATLAPGPLVEPPAARTERRSPTPAAGQRSPVLAAGRRSSTPVTGQRMPLPAAMSSGGGGSAASADTPTQTASRPRDDLRATPPGQASGGVSVPRARRSGTNKHNMSARSE
ncbi:uncharacterized protein LOC120674518 [Panicum virgatum]|uniref:uncharacterized protein LOC120674518 n=1 Tax=Panicum virgatum TaxID=38727 RepID=UPI0019D6508B|nr:uncharacterized protein LOC120674518 [Panicum virgatum]